MRYKSRRESGRLSRGPRPSPEERELFPRERIEEPEHGAGPFYRAHHHPRAGANLGSGGTKRVVVVVVVVVKRRRRRRRGRFPPGEPSATTPSSPRRKREQRFLTTSTCCCRGKALEPSGRAALAPPTSSSSYCSCHKTASLTRKLREGAVRSTAPCSSGVAEAATWRRAAAAAAAAKAAGLCS